MNAHLEVLATQNVHLARRATHTAENGLVGKNIMFERTRRITGYLSKLSKFNNAKRAEERDRKKHNLKQIPG